MRTNSLNSFQQQLKCLPLVSTAVDSSEVQIHTFSDASQRAYGTVTFLRVKHMDRISVDLVTSKSYVAHLKKLFLPRLQLMGALLDACLTKEVKKLIDLKCPTTAFFLSFTEQISLQEESESKIFQPTPSGGMDPHF
ncbi:hypothetical protein NPIL_312801 [Nephila pilipes]|uniref:Uncharacterized protein n=1 Tax=Nephila pilipes TaxID=299642 RepID=A0A8X6PGW5_NEPPI|nr:hypothetical protein NPIL_312801 [Nephila pilipes]